MTEIETVSVDLPGIKKRKIENEEEQDKVNKISKTIKEEVIIINEIPLTNENLNILLPSGYEIMEIPEGYENGIVDYKETEGIVGYMIPEVSNATNKILKDSIITSVPGMNDLQYFKEEDMKYFGKLINNKSNKELSIDEIKEEKVMKLLLKIKNGNSQSRKIALKQLTDNCKKIGGSVIFKQILPLLMESSLNDHERHLLVKVISRILFKLNTLIKPFSEEILKVISPLLINENLLMRKESSEIIANLIKSTGLSQMIKILKKNIETSDEKLRIITCKIFAIIAKTLGIQSLLPFLKAICNSKKSWIARFTGGKIIQEISKVMGYNILPFLNELIDCIKRNLNDENNLVKRSNVLAINSLAEVVKPFGIESFEKILNTLWKGIKNSRGVNLQIYFKTFGNLILLMDEEIGSYYVKEIFKILLREFNTNDDEMKKSILNLINNCLNFSVITNEYLMKNSFLEIYFKNFWNRRSAYDYKLLKLIINTTVNISNIINYELIVDKIIYFLKDDNENLRKMSLETINEIIIKKNTNQFEIEKLEERLIDGILICIQKSINKTNQLSLIKTFETICLNLTNIKNYLPQIISIILFRLKNESIEIRQQSADLLSKIIPIINNNNELIKKLIKILYESLGEIYPEVLGSILSCLKQILLLNLNIKDFEELQLNELLPNLIPILKNRHEKVEENVIEIIGLIAMKFSEFIPNKEWMRICFELLNLLKSFKKSIRRSANKTFGIIAKIIGPQEIIITLLNNLRVQERQLRICTAVAIGIIAKECQPFTVLPMIMNEYRTPEKNVQNGVLKSMTFLFEYINGEMIKDYLLTILPLLEDALIDKDLIHRQTAATVIKHLSINCFGFGLEDFFLHFLNLLMPNVFETSPHLIERILESINAIRFNIGPGMFMNYILQGIWHCARKVRNSYWKLYNDCYIQSCDSMVPYYPKIELVEEDKSYAVEELELWV